jgi:two-component system, NtrC family, sensor kinase
MRTTTRRGASSILRSAISNQAILAFRSGARSAAFSACASATTATALDLLERGEAFDAVLSDIVMEGGVSGLDLAERIRERWPDLPVLLMTGYSEALTTGSSQGLTVLSKPFREADLMSALRAVRQGAAPAKGSPSNVIRLSR